MERLYVATAYERRGRTGNLSCSFLHRSSSGTIVAPRATSPISLACFFAKTSDVSTRLSPPPSRKCLSRCHRRRERKGANKSVPHPSTAAPSIYTHAAHCRMANETTIREKSSQSPVLPPLNISDFSLGSPCYNEAESPGLDPKSRDSYKATI